MDWWNSLLMVLLVAGHTEFLVVLVNRLHALPIHDRVLHRLRLVHDIAVPAFPFVLFYFVGARGPALLFGGSWSSLSPGWRFYLTLCAAGLVVLVFSVVRWMFNRPPAHQTEQESEILDLSPADRGSRGLVARLPWNEVFHLESNEKTFRHPNLPSQWAGLTICHYSDFHFGHDRLGKEYFEKVIAYTNLHPPDIAVFTGDLVDEENGLDWLADTLGRVEARLGKFFILGNHDWMLDEQRIREAVEKVGWTDVAGRTLELDVDGRTLEIGGSERPWIGRHPAFDPQTDVFRLFLCHTPDYMQWARDHQVDLMLSGHNHGGQIVLPVVGPVYSPSRTGTKYAAGTYWNAPTLLHVSRGVSGTHALRWNCLPEVTTIRLEPAVLPATVPQQVPQEASVAS